MRCLPLRCLLLFLALLPLSRLFASPPDTLWTQTWGSPRNDMAWDVRCTQDGGFIVAGSTTNANDEQEALLIRYDYDGSLVWTWTYPEAGAVEAAAVVETLEREFYVGGRGPEDNAVAFKVDCDGALIWAREYNRPGFRDTPLPALSDLTLMPDGGFVAKAERGALVFRCDENGDTLWLREFGDPLVFSAAGLETTTDGGIILLAAQQNCGILYPVLYRLTPLGGLIWEHPYSIPALGDSVTAWTKDLTCTADGGYAFTGYFSRGYYFMPDIFLVRATGNGDTLFTRTLGARAFADYAFGVEGTADSGVVVCGTLGNEGLSLVKVNLQRGIDWVRHSQTNGFLSKGIRVRQTAQQGYICVGYNHGQQSFNRDIYLVHYNPPFTAADDSPVARAFALHPAYPNPFNSRTIIRFELPATERVSLAVYDITGREQAVLLDQRLAAGDHTAAFNAEGLPSGIYLCRLQAGSAVHTQKLVLLK